MGKRKSSSSQPHTSGKRTRSSASPNETQEENVGNSSAEVNESLNDSLDLTVRRGKILTVKLRNFMCHANLTVDFNPRTNLLIGQNGSGKSAILTALIIGLGAKANATNRSSSIKDLIKTGESSATIEVHVSNDGSDAYEHELFGNRIVVVRQIAASGSSTYKLKSASGNVISTSRSDLLKLILYMNIQVDNPVCVMTQDASRGFLLDSNPKKRYELFLKATQLDVVIERLDQATNQINVARGKFKAQQRQHTNLLQIQDTIKKKLNQFRSMEPLKQETKRYKSEKTWLAVEQEEELIGTVNSELEKAQKKKDECERKLGTCNVSDQEMNEQNQRITQEIEEQQRLLSEGERNLTAEKNKYKQALDQVSANERKVKTLDTKREKAKQNIETLEENIQAELNSNKDHIDEMKKANEAKLKELYERQKDTESTLKSHRHELEMYNNTRNKNVKQLDKAKQDQSGLSEEKRKIEMRLRNIHASPKENLKLLGNHMVTLVDRLEQAHKKGKFQKMPIGPIANHVEVKDVKYRQYVEDALGNILMAFCVDNANDLTVFREILKTMQPALNVPLICAQFTDRQYDVRGKCVERDNHTMRLMDMIVADDPVVMNCLIDQCSIETTLLTTSFEHATHITSKRENVPQNLFKVILTQPYSEYFPAPAYRSYTKTPRPTRVMRVNAADREKTYRDEIDEINEKIEKTKLEIQQIQNKIAENGKLIDERRKLINDLDSNLSVLRLEINETESVEYPREADVEVMQNEVTEQSKILEKIDASYEQERAALDELNGVLQEIKANMTAIREQTRGIENEIATKQKSKDEISEKLTKRDSLATYYQRQIRTCTEAIDKYERELEKSREKLNRLVVAAQKTGPRIEVTHNDEQLNKLIKKNETKLNAVSETNETLESVTQQAEEADENVMRSEELLKILSSALKMLHNSIQMRMQNVQKLKKFMITRTSTYFTAIMELRQCTGTLQFDSDASTLDIQVIPRDKECENAVSKTTILSGGERSYTTVAFLLSLWSCVDHPFYFLDEYDVFTDPVNRMFMTKLLLNEAKKKPLQYTFLTPQDTSEIKKTKDLDILRLENPNR